MANLPSWKVGTRLQAAETIQLTKPPIRMSGVVNLAGTPLKPRQLVSLNKGAKFRVVKDQDTEPTGCIHIQRMKASTDTGEIDLLLELENPSQWKILG
jgi:hypothetical protein